MERNNTKLGIFMAVLGPSLWGIMSIFTRRLSSAGVTPAELCCCRGILTFILYFAVFSFTDKAAIRISFKDICICMAFGIVAYCGGYMTYVTSVELIPVSVATVLMFTCPVWVILMGIVFFREKVEGYKIISIAVCFAGAILVVDLFGTEIDGGLSIPGAILAILNAICAASQLMWPRYFEGRIKKDSFIMYGYLAGGLVVLPFVDFTAFSVTLSGPDGPACIKSLLILILICTFIANYSFMNASNYLNTTLVGILSAFEVVVGTIVGVLYFKEELSVTQMLGAVIIVAGAMFPSIIETRKK